MAEHSILFSGAMIRAILDGRKTQTRRVVSLREFGPSDTRGYDWHFRDRRLLWNDVSTAGLLRLCRYGQPGDRLWVREAFAQLSRIDGAGSLAVAYRASCRDDSLDLDLLDGSVLAVHVDRWAPSVHMPRWASRITLELTSVRVERLQDISEEDARAEGVTADAQQGTLNGEAATLYPMTHRQAFIWLWDAINGARAPWASNPWVWALQFRRIDG